MKERELISLGSQLTRSYSDNHKAPYQAHMFVSSWGGQLKDRFDTVLERHHENWKGVTFMEEDFVKAAETAKQLMRAKTGGKLAGAFAIKTDDKIGIAKGAELVTQDAAAKDEAIRDEPWSAQQSQPSEIAIEEEERLMVEKLAPVAKENAAMGENGVAVDTELSTSGPPEDPKRQAPGLDAQEEGEIIYLTSDSPHTLDRLQPYIVYIVGGLVDKNRHKGICYKTACARGIKTAKLPIGEFMEMQSRFVLATNHVVEIMIRWLECGDWGESFMKVMPKRKGGVLKGAHGIKQEVYRPKLEVEDSNPGFSDSREPKARFQEGDVLETGQNLPSTTAVS
jgi:tRNA (guanine9-N1)-methyltransferase